QPAEDVRHCGDPAHTSGPYFGRRVRERPDPAAHPSLRRPRNPDDPRGPRDDLDLAACFVQERCRLQSALAGPDHHHTSASELSGLTEVDGVDHEWLAELSELRRPS